MGCAGSASSAPLSRQLKMTKLDIKLKGETTSPSKQSLDIEANEVVPIPDSFVSRLTSHVVDNDLNSERGVLTVQTSLYSVESSQKSIMENICKYV